MNTILSSVFHDIRNSLNFIMQTMLVFSLPLVDSTVLSLLGKDQAIAGSSVGIILGSFFTLIYALTFGASSFLSQSYDKDKVFFFRHLKSISQLSIFSAIIIVISFVVFRGFYQNFTSIPSVDEQLNEYLYYFPAITILYAFSSIIDLYLYNSGSSRKCLYLTCVEVISNAMLSIYFGLLCNLPFISGVAGVAVASVIAKLLKILLFALMKCCREAFFISIKQNVEIKITCAVFMKTLPYFFNGLMWVVYGYMIYKLILNIAYEEMFIYSLMIPWISFCFTAPAGFSNYYSISLAKKIVSNSVSNYDITIVLTAFMFMVLVIFIALLSVFNFIYFNIINYDEIDHYAYPLIALFVLLRSLNILLSSGVLKSGLDNFFVFMTDTLVMWLVCFPMLFYYSNMPDFSLTIVFSFYVIEESLKSIVYCYRVQSKKWIVNLYNAS
ncbi:hypothetical protein [Cedecea neteri]|uniref:hypothetical protein n=1 Tax=Cedecea neteri TaxID=158822 RepID=UPI0004F90A59|nr:hypothetical protein [Cedecea neteri]AIR64299.1 hypothetical protein LH86_04140 [Cedecea neteri]